MSWCSINNINLSYRWWFWRSLLSFSTRRSRSMCRMDLILMTVRNLKDCRLRHKTHLLVLIYSLNSNRIILALHSCRRLQPVRGLAISCINRIWRALTILLSNSEPILLDWCATSLRWFIPGYHYSFLRDGLDFNARWLWNTDRCHVCSVKHTLLVHMGLVKVKSTWICHCDTSRIQSLATSEAESKPIFLTNVWLVERQIYFIDWTSVTSREDLHMCHYLSIAFLASSLVLINIPLWVDHVVKVSNLVKLHCLHSYKWRIGIVAILGQFDTITLTLGEVNVTDRSFWRLEFYVKVKVLYFHRVSIHISSWHPSEYNCEFTFFKFCNQWNLNLIAKTRQCKELSLRI